MTISRAASRADLVPRSTDVKDLARNSDLFNQFNASLWPLIQPPM
jgi:hypothetical protein